LNNEKTSNSLGKIINQKPEKRNSEIYTPSMISRLSERKSSYSDKNDMKKRLFSEEQSQTILNRIKFLRIKKLFDSIDVEKKGRICKEDIVRFRGEPLVVKILNPIFEEVVGKGVELTVLDFEEKMDCLFMNISANDRMVLLDGPTNSL
jgi:Ca2+-binding EF-hand superfamily protein